MGILIAVLSLYLGGYITSVSILCFMRYHGAPVEPYGTILKVCLLWPLFLVAQR